MRWTKEINTNIMRAYFRAIKCESQTTRYPTLFYSEWKKIHSKSTVTKQRICDQRRVIRNVLLTTTEIYRIKTDIPIELNATVTETPTISNEYYDETIIYTVDPALEEIESNTPNVRTIPNEIQTEFNKVLIEYQGSQPKTRPSLPKISYNRKAKLTVESMNSFIEFISSIEQIHLTGHAAATAVCRILNLKFPLNQLKNKQIQKLIN
jgi:hypothetical protein